MIAFSSAAVAQSVLIGDDGWATPQANTKTGEALVENSLFSLKHGLQADSFEVVLTCPEDNWRRSVCETYKRHRTGERPLLLDYLKGYLREAHGAYHWPGLEADDVLSVQMTTPPELVPLGWKRPPMPYRLVCVGRDKDFKSIPGLHHTWKADVSSAGVYEVREVSQWEADRFHLIQTLSGDATDGYYGCPGLGMKRAAEIVDNPVRLVPRDGIKTRGVNKGEAVTRWFAEECRDWWAVVVSHYRKAGLGEAEALVTARLARLLRHGEYDPETEELRLWVPQQLQGVGA